MPFKKADKNINRSGRPVGSSERVQKIRDKLLDLIDENYDSMKLEFGKFSAKDKFLILDKLLRYVMPSPEPINILDAMTEKDLDRLIDHLKKQIHDKAEN